MNIRSLLRPIVAFALLAVAPLCNADSTGVERAYVDSRFGQLHVRVTGPTGNSETRGLPLILLHQVPNSSQVFETFMPLIAADRRVIAFDLPGFGMSDAVTGGETINNYAKAVLDGIENLGFDRIDILGYHTGAAVAVEIDRLRPALVRRVALVSVPILTEEEREQFAALPPIPFDESGEFAKQEWQRSMRWRGPGQSTESVKRTFAEKMRPGARERGASAVVGYDLAATLADLSKPLLIVRPKDDLWDATLRARPLAGDAVWIDLADFGHGLFEVAGDSMATIVREFFEPVTPAPRVETRDYKTEDWYDAKLYPDAPHIRESTLRQEPIEDKLLRIKRPLVIVKDLERSLEFYVDIIGLEVYKIDPYFNRDPQSLGYQMFDVPVGARKRMATLNTSDEIRGLTLQEVRDMEVRFDNKPRAFTILFETDDLLGIRARAAKAGFNVIEPLLAEIPSTDKAPRLRFMEFAIIDPDNHVIAFFQYFDSDEEWAEAQRIYEDLSDHPG